MIPSIALLLALQTPPPSPSTIMCDHDATVTAQVAPDYPEAAREAHVGAVTASVRVYVTPSGTVAALRIFTSTGNDAIDQATIRAAAASTYSSRVKNCKPAFGLYVFKVTYSPNQ